MFRGDTFTCTTEDFLTSDTTYVAQLREELWQALAAHVAARTLQKVDAALDCLEEVRGNLLFCSFLDLTGLNCSPNCG